MDNKQKKIVVLVIFAIVVIAVAVWLIVRSPASDNYDYEGFVIDVRQSSEGTVVTAINAKGQSEFVITWSTKKEFKDDKNGIEAGDCIRLSTKRDGTTVKKFSVFKAFYTEGKLVNVAGADSPVLITDNLNTGTYKVYKLIPAEGTIPAMPTGTPIRIYYQYALNSATEQVVVDVVQPISDILKPLTEKEREYIAARGFTIAE